VAERFAGKGFVLLSISLDQDCEAARKMIKQEHLSWTHVCEGGFESAVAKLYNVMGIPTTYLIGPDGRIAAKDLREHAIDEAVARLVQV
jgi:peroxiredoxin